MDEPNACQGVSELLKKLIAVCLPGGHAAQAQAQLKRTAFTTLLGLDRDEQVTTRWCYLLKALASMGQ